VEEGGREKETVGYESFAIHGKGKEHGKMGSIALKQEIRLHRQ